MKTLTYVFSLGAFLSLASCGTDYKDKHAEIDKQQAQEMIENADRVEVDGKTITVKED